MEIEFTVMPWIVPNT